MICGGECLKIVQLLLRYIFVECKMAVQWAQQCEKYFLHVCFGGNK